MKNQSLIVQQFSFKNMNHMKIDRSQGSLCISKASASAHPEPGTMKGKIEQQIQSKMDELMHVIFHDEPSPAYEYTLNTTESKKIPPNVTTQLYLIVIVLIRKFY
jgi:hypothetical protein